MNAFDIINGLRKCSSEVAQCDNCPYKGDPPDPECYNRLYNDAADTIESMINQAIAEKQEKIREIQNERLKDQMRIGKELVLDGYFIRTTR